MSQARWSQEFPCKTIEEWAVTHRRKCSRNYWIPASVPKMALKRRFFNSFHLGQNSWWEKNCWNLPKQLWLMLSTVTEACGHAQNLSEWTPWNSLQKSEDRPGYLEFYPRYEVLHHVMAKESKSWNLTKTQLRRGAVRPKEHEVLQAVEQCYEESGLGIHAGQGNERPMWLIFLVGRRSRVYKTAQVSISGCDP